MRKSLIFVVCILGILLSISANSHAKIADNDIIALWTFDTGGKEDAVDISGNGHDGTLDLGASIGGGKVGSGAHLDGEKGQIITVENDDALNVTKQLSIVAWVKWNEGGVEHGGVRQWPMIVNKAPINAAYLLFLDTGDAVNAARPSIAFRMNGPGTVYSNVTVEEETWYHAAGTYDGEAIKIYIDGEFSNELKASGDIATTTDVLTIGAGKGAAGNRFDGIVDEVGLFNRALTDDEVKETMVGFDKMLAVEPNGKLANTWGALKYR